MICDNRIKSKGNASAQNNPDSLPNPLHLGLSKVVKLKGWLSVVKQECKVPIFKISTVAITTQSICSKLQIRSRQPILANFSISNLI